jgi:plastocyanin
LPPLFKSYMTPLIQEIMKHYRDTTVCNRDDNEIKRYIACTFVIFALVILYMLAMTDSAIFKRGVTNALALPSNQTMVAKNNASIEKAGKPANKQTLTLSNITKLTTTQGNVTTNANAASSYPPKEANATKVFPPNNKVAIILGAALKRDKAYQPNPVNVKTGGTVVWANEDTVVHTVTSGSGFNDQNFGREFDSGFLGKSFSHIFFKPGVFPYFCEIHPTMVGKVIVK